VSAFSPERHRRARERAGLSREAEAVLIGRSVSVIYRWESGDRVPSSQVIGNVAKVLGVPVDELFAESSSLDEVGA
jgi:transcriptional regulator with XRE-family HTH domain